MQAILFQQSGKYIKYREEILQNAAIEEQAILENFLKFKRGEEVDFAEASQLLLSWTKRWISEV